MAGSMLTTTELLERTESAAKLVTMSPPVATPIPAPGVSGHVASGGRERLRRARQFGPRCPDCGGPLVHGEGCRLCPICGHSSCG